MAVNLNNKHRCTVVGNPGGSLGFLANSFEGGTLTPLACIYDNKCVVAKLGAQAESILSQNLEWQGFFREAERKKETESEKDNEK
jgi:hypothetical protein